MIAGIKNVAPALALMAALLLLSAPRSAPCREMRVKPQEKDPASRTAPRDDETGKHLILDKLPIQAAPEAPGATFVIAPPAPKIIKVEKDEPVDPLDRLLMDIRSLQRRFEAAPVGAGVKERLREEKLLKLKARAYLRAAKAETRPEGRPERG